MFVTNWLAVLGYSYSSLATHMEESGKYTTLLSGLAKLQNAEGRQSYQRDLRTAAKASLGGGSGGGASGSSRLQVDKAAMPGSMGGAATRSSVNAVNADYDPKACNQCGEEGHWRKNCPVLLEALQLRTQHSRCFGVQHV